MERQRCKGQQLTGTAYCMAASACRPALKTLNPWQNKGSHRHALVAAVEEQDVAIAQVQGVAHDAGLGHLAQVRPLGVGVGQLREERRRGWGGARGLQ